MDKITILEERLNSWKRMRNFYAREHDLFFNKYEYHRSVGETCFSNAKSMWFNVEEADFKIKDYEEQLKELKEKTDGQV